MCDEVHVVNDRGEAYRMTRINDRLNSLQEIVGLSFLSSFKQA